MVRGGFILDAIQTAAAGAATSVHDGIGVTARAERRWAFGPGVVLLLASVGPNDVIVNSLVAARYGYSLLWALIPAYALHFCIAEASSRYVLTTGESIIEGFARFGRSAMIVLAGGILLRRHLNNLFLVPLMGQSLDMLLPLPVAHGALAWSVASTAIAFALMAVGGYAGVERRGRYLVALQGGALLAIAVMARPDATAVARGLLVPQWPGGDAIVLLMALASATIGTINHLKYPAFVFEKGWRDVTVIRAQRVDLALSCLGQLAMAVLIQVAVAATLHGGGVPIRTMQDLAGLFSTSLGEAGRTVFLIGMWATVCCSYIGSNTGYSLVDADIYERFLRRPRRGAPESRDVVRRRAYVFFLTLFCVPPLYVLFTSWEPFWIGVVGGAIFFAFAPLLLVGLLALTSRRGWMRDRTSGWMSKIAIGFAVALSVALTYQGLRDLLARLLRHAA